MSVIVEIAVDPIGTGSPSVGDYIKIAIDVIRRSGYKYEIGPMGTSVELPSVEALGKLLQDIHDTLYKAGIKRIVTTVRIDDRRDKAITMAYKVERVSR
ncbi:MTH1187 family thiamine-binding protein [Vulcanisaeta distributa]|uniref:MTH1187 family thiamine-binding protein n=1 Tax=Vulcanisaeta distributa TaxID=164451 RepID=UPI0006CF65DA|nr:MTH1187 family thiamine-binding protein [Vulcanisaeta distributa]